MSEPLWVETPLIHSKPLSRRLNCQVYLKLETFQPSFSFKFRGISLFLQRAGSDVHCVVASSGNAALSAACAAAIVGRPCTAFMPLGTSPELIEATRREGADVRVGGADYFEALSAARQFIAEAPDGSRLLVPAYDDPILWEGHSSIVAEMSKQLPRNIKPDAILCAVGGGGLLGGVLQGCEAEGWNDVPIVTLETRGADVFYHSYRLNKDPTYASRLLDGMRAIPVKGDSPAFVELDAITSCVSSLGARSPSLRVLSRALSHPGGIIPVVVNDAHAMHSALQFADEHKLLVELACSTALTPASFPALFHRVVPKHAQCVVFVLCGGFKVTARDLEAWKAELDDTESLGQILLEDGILEFERP